MEFCFRFEEERFRKEVKDFLKQELPPDWVGWDMIREDEDTFEIFEEIRRKLGDKGWLTLTWPRKYGGLEASFTEQLILAEELAYHRIMAFDIGATWVGPIILSHGTEAQKRKYLPDISKGKVRFCLGYSEPEAGSDLASLQTRAAKQGNEYVVNGQKTFTSFAHKADYIWLAARTKSDFSKHKGISLFVIDLKLPGITIRPLTDILNRHSFNEVFFDDVHVPDDCLIGGEGNGWNLLMEALAEERRYFGGGINPVAQCQWFFEKLLNYARQNGLIDDPQIRRSLSEMKVDIEVGRLLAYAAVLRTGGSVVNIRETTVSRIYGAKLVQRLANSALDILGLYAQLHPTSRWAQLEGEVHNLCLESVSETVGAGTLEIMKSTIAVLVLGLPRE